MNITPRFGFVVEYVEDIEASKRFCVDVLGLKVERSHPTFVVEEPAESGRAVSRALT